MDFRSRGVQSPITPAAGSTSTGNSGNNFNKPALGKWLERGSVALLIGLGLLVAGVIVLSIFGNDGQAGIIKKDKYQAVFLNNGQVYFGHIKGLNDKFVNLNSIYYLQTQNTGSDTTAAAASGNVTLVKLGCELHGPYDQMVINADQVLFWENLQDDSQVVKKIAESIKANPTGKCATADASATTDQATPNAATQSTGNTTTQSTTTTTKKP